MLEVKNPEIKVDDIMRRIQEKIRLRQESTVGRQGPRGAAAPRSVAAEWFWTIRDLLNQAQDLAPVGDNLPPMSRMRGLQRAVATPLAKIFLRVAQLITRDQRRFNQVVVAALQALLDRLIQDGARDAQVADQLTREVGGLASRLTELEARLAVMDQRAAGESPVVGHPP